MRRSLRTVGLALGLPLIVAFVSSCTDAPSATSMRGVNPRYAKFTSGNAVRVSEIHYDNALADVGEKIEISGPAGASLTGWSLVLYNGASTSRATYSTQALSGTIPATCGARGVVVISYPQDGIQNGAPDGWALVSPAGLVEFMSYEGTFVAANGAAAGQTSTSIGVSEAGTEVTGLSLKRDGAGIWSAPSAHNFGACNDSDEPPPPVVVESVTVSPVDATIAVGSSQAFTATAWGSDDAPIAGTTFEWSTSDANVATVNSSGVASGVAVGIVDVIAKAGDKARGAALTVTAAPPPPASPLRINEIHYDNVSTDAGEAIEIEGPAGTSLAGWSVVLYNGNGGANYNTQNLTGSIPASCGGRGVVVVNYPSNGIQNGSPDAIALVGPTGVAEFISYEGVVAATAGPANGKTSADIGVSQDPDNSVPVGYTLQRDAAGTWYGPETSTLGACNTPPIQSAATIVINEIMTDPLRAAGGSSWGEWFEVHNYGTAPVDLQGWTIASFGHPDHVIGSSVVVPPGGYSVLGRGADFALNGGITLAYNYFVGSTNTIFLDASDRLELRDAAGARVDIVRWTAGSLGVSRGVRDPLADNADVANANWGYSTAPFGDGDYGTPGAANGTLSTTRPIIPNFVTFSGRATSDAALPVGFESQVFANLTSGATGTTIASTFTWTSETQSIASIDARGVIRALAPGMATFRATAADGTSGTYSLPMSIGVSGTTAQYGPHAEFGEPTDGDASDDFIVRRAEFTSSFNTTRNIPNWVAYNLEATHIGTQDRCDCFTYDPLLPADFRRYTTADYTGAGTFHGYGIDRGHLTRSFDRTTGTLDNARTFYFSNVIPQAADNNQGPWAIFENYLGNLATAQNKELYIIAGASGSKGTVKNEGLITIPATTWKVAVIMPRNAGVADVDSWSDLEVIAVIMPNEPGIRNVPWETYKTTVDAVELLSGYDLLALLPDQVEIAVESNTRPPVASVNGPFTIVEGGSVSLAGSGTDADGDALTYAWQFGDGASATGANASHTYAQNGTYTATLTVTDGRGLFDQASTMITVANVAPTITSFDLPLSVVSGQPIAASGTFTDPGPDAPWTFSYAWGEGSVSPGFVTSTAITASASHTYLAAGSYTVRFTVTDKDGGTAYLERQLSVSRVQVSSDVNPNRVNLNNNGNGRVIVRVLSSASFDATTLNVASARVGSVAAVTSSVDDVNGDGRADLLLHFEREALVAGGALSATTSQLVLLADLVDGRQVESRASVIVR